MGNVKAAIKDDKAHMDYLKRDVKDDQRAGGKYKDINQTADEKHISKLAGDVRYDEKKEGMSRNASPLNDFKGGYHKVQHAKGEAHKSPAKNITYGDKSGPTGYIGEERKDLMKYNPVDDKAGMSRYKSDAQRKAVHASKADGGMSRQKYGGNKGDERRSATKDYDSPASIRKSNSTKKDYDGMSRYGGNKGDIRRSAKRDY